MPWSDLTEESGRMLAFTRRLIDIRRRHIVFRRSRFFHGRQIPGTTVRDVVWLRPDGEEMAESDWHNPHLHSLQVLISGEAGSRFLSPTGQQEPDESFLLILHAGTRRRRFTVPGGDDGGWKLEIASGKVNRRREMVYLPRRTFALLRRHTERSHD